MSIIFYEQQYCESLLKHKIEINQRNLNFLSKYWKGQDISENEIYIKLEDICLYNNCNPILNRNKIKNAINHAKRYSLRETPLPVTVCRSDLDKIALINNYQYEKIIFSMLVCAKYFKYHISRNRLTKRMQPSEILYSNQKIKDIMELAGVKLTKKEWNTAKHILCVEGYISPTIYSKEKFGLWLEEKNMIDGIVVIDYRNIISYYEQFKGMPMLHCCECGVMCLRNSSTQKMCKDCSKRKESINRYNRVKKHRGNKK